MEIHRHTHAYKYILYKYRSVWVGYIKFISGVNRISLPTGFAMQRNERVFLMPIRFKIH